MPGPILGFDIPFGAEDGTWTEAGQYCVWTQRFPHDAAPLYVEELVEGAVRRGPEEGTSFRLIPAGMTHRIIGLFDFWRESEADTLFFRSVQDDDVRYAVVVSVGAMTYGDERMFWTCPECGSEFASHTYDAKRHGFRAFWQFALERGRAFAEDAAARTCQGCGTAP